MDSYYLVEDGCLCGHEGVGYFKASRKPVLRIENIIGVMDFLFFKEAGLCGEAVEADCEIGYFLNNFIA